MSIGLMKLSSPSGLVKSTGLRGKENFKFSLDGECLYLRGVIGDTQTDTVDVILEEATGGKKAKIRKDIIRRYFTLNPAEKLIFNVSSKASSTRLLVQPNPLLYNYGVVNCPSIIEPHQDLLLTLTLTCFGPNVLESIPEEVLKDAFRIYAIN